MAGLQFVDTKDYEYRDITVFLDGAKVTKLRGAKYKKRRDKELVKVGGGKIAGIHSGDDDTSGEIRILLGQLRQLNKAARAAGGGDILDIAVDIVIVYRAKGSRKLATDTLVGVEFTEYEQGMDQGDKFKEVSLPILFTDLIPFDA